MTCASPGQRLRHVGAAVDRRAQRERDRAAGLVPFAVKLHGELVRQLHELARQRGLPLNELVDQLLRTGTEHGGGTR